MSETRTPPALAIRRKNYAFNGQVRLDNRLSFMDQAMFLTMRAMDRKAVVQCVWVYEHAVDLGALRRFHHNLGYGLLGRRIERSPLPFARYRWVCCRGSADIDIADSARPRAELSDWVDERAQVPIDPERGPGWHLGLTPLTDGATAVSLVASHCLIDGLGIGLAVAEAAHGQTRDLGYPPPRSRTRLRALAQDARRTAHGAPEIARAIVAAVKLARHRPEGTTAPAAPARPRRAVDHGDERLVIPAIAINVNLDAWDARAKALGGTSHHLAAALSAKLGEYLGRRRADGTVTLQIPLSDRTEDDTRANTLSFVSVTVDPTVLTTDLSDLRAAVRNGFDALREAPEQTSPTLLLAPLVPFTPKPVLRRTAEALFAYADLPVAFSSLGEIAAAAACIDGTDAEYVFGAGVLQDVTRQSMERALGELSLVFFRIGRKMCITVIAYQPGRENSKPQLRALAARALAEFDLTGGIE